MTGTIVNVVAVLVGGGIGLLIKNGINEKIHSGVTHMMGIATFVIGLNGLLGTMLTVDTATGRVSSGGEMLLLLSLVIGAVLGEIIGIDDALTRFGNAMESRFKASNFSKGFVSASLLFCVGAMAIVGSINDGLSGDSTVLFVKSALDFISSIVLASTLGAGVLFAAGAVLVYQGALTLLGSALSTVLVGALLNNICMVGYAMVVCISINFFDVVKIKTANLLPALLIPIAYQYLYPLVAGIFAR